MIGAKIENLAVAKMEAIYFGKVKIFPAWNDVQAGFWIDIADKSYGE